jgi:hypothetical protein
MRLHARLLACGVMPACKQSGKCTQMLSDREESLLGEGLPWAVPVGVMTILTNCRKFLMGVHRLAVLSKMSSPTLPCGGRRCVPLRFRWHCCVLENARVCERVVTESSMQFVSSDLLVNNYGVSAAYQSPAHVDPSDVGFTFAFAVKCD